VDKGDKGLAFGVWAIRGFQFVDLEKVRDLKSVWKDLDWFGVWSVIESRN
jgi:hypothetical protein